MGVFMKHNNLIILITLVVSVSYIFGMDYYDRKQIQTAKLYEKIALPDITYTEINLSLKGMKEKQKLDKKAIALKHSQSLEQLSHQAHCSKLCTGLHPINCQSQFIEEGENLTIVIAGQDSKTPYTLSMKTQKDLEYNTYYNMEITGLKDIVQIDHLRNRTLLLFEKWGVKPKESLAFKGIISGSLDQGQRKAMAEEMLLRLGGKATGYYGDDHNETTEAYYGYTQGIKEYILANDHEKTNIQVSFSYNEVAGVTQVVIAFPFYNEPF